MWYGKEPFCITVTFFTYQISLILLNQQFNVVKKTQVLYYHAATQKEKCRPKMKRNSKGILQTGREIQKCHSLWHRWHHRLRLVQRRLSANRHVGNSGTLCETQPARGTSYHLQIWITASYIYFETFEVSPVKTQKWLCGSWWALACT